MAHHDKILGVSAIWEEKISNTPQSTTSVFCFVTEVTISQYFRQPCRLRGGNILFAEPAWLWDFLNAVLPTWFRICRKVINRDFDNIRVCRPLRCRNIKASSIEISGILIKRWLGIYIFLAFPDSSILRCLSLITMQNILQQLSSWHS